MIVKDKAGAEAILAANEQFQQETGCEALRPEAKIIFSLRARGSLSIKEAMLLSGLSYRGFYIVMARLLQLGLIKVNGGQEDRRVRKITLVDEPEPKVEMAEAKTQTA